MDHREEVHSQLLESCRQAAALLEPTDALLDAAASPIQLLVEAMPSIVLMLVDASWDDTADRMTTQPLPDAREAVAFVASEARRSSASSSRGSADAHAVHDRFEPLGLVDLPRRDVRGEGESATVSNQVELAAESAARAAERVVFGLFGAPFFPAPAAARDARSVVPSTHQRSQSIRPSASSRICSASRMRSNTLVRRQELKW